MPPTRLRTTNPIGWLAMAVCALVHGGCQWAAYSQNSEGVALYQQAYYEGALTRFQQAIQSDPNNADGYYNLGATYYRLGKLHSRTSDYAQAESYYRQCLDHSNYNHPECFRGLAVVMVEQGRSQEAFKLLDDWALRNSTSPTPQIELARLYEEAGDRDSARQHLIEAVAADPSNAQSLAALGKLREETGDTAQALANYERSLELNRFQPQVAARVASLRMSTSAPVVTPPNGTRTVTTPAVPLR